MGRGGQSNLEVGDLSPDLHCSESSVGQRDWSSFWWCDGKSLWALCVWWSWHYSQRTKAPGVLVKTSALAQMAVFVLSKRTQPGNGLQGHNFSFLLTGPISEWVKGTLVVTYGEVVAGTLVLLWPRLWWTWLWRSPTQGLVLSLGSIMKYKIYHLERWNDYMCSLHIRVLQEIWWISWEILFSRTIPLGMGEREPYSSLLEVLHLKSPRQSERVRMTPL